MQTVPSDADLRTWIKRRLGEGVICVELTDDQLDDCIQRSKEFWRAFIGQPKMVLMTTNGVSYIEEATIGPDVDCVVEVSYPVHDYLLNLFNWAGVEINPYNWVYSGNGGYSTLVQLMQYREMGNRIVSADQDWEWDRAQRRLILTPIPDSGQQIGVVYLSTEVDLAKFTNYEWWLFREYVHTQAMKTLAFIRSKYADKPSATGSISMDGDALYANADIREKEIEEKIRQLSMPTGFWAL